MTIFARIPWKERDDSKLQEKYQKTMATGDKRYETTKENQKQLTRKIIFIIFLIFLSVYIFLSFYKPPLPKRKDILSKLVSQEPRQGLEVLGDQLINIEEFRYKIYPQFSYEIYGLVVSQYKSENLLDVMHKNDPAQIKDLCIVWGSNISSGVYKDLDYKSGEFTCFTKPKEGESLVAFSGKHLSNNHLIPKNDQIASEIRKVGVGDQIYIKGYLSNYEVYDRDGSLLSTRGTSITRDDTGNGACETIYATEFEILKGNNYLLLLAKSLTGIISLISLLILVFMVLFV